MFCKAGAKEKGGSVEVVMIFCQAKFDQVLEALKKRKFIHTQCRFIGVTARISKTSVLLDLPQALDGKRDLQAFQTNGGCGLQPLCWSWSLTSLGCLTGCWEHREDGGLQRSAG